MRVIILIFLLHYSLYAWPDYNIPSHELNEDELNIIQKTMEKEIPWFKFDSGNSLVISKKRLSLKLIKLIVSPKLCRLETLEVISSKNLKRIYETKNIEFYFSKPLNGSCSKYPSDFVWTREVKTPDFLAINVLSNKSYILKESEKVTGVSIDIDTMALVKMIFSELSESKAVVIELTFLSKVSNQEISTYVDVINDKFVLISATARERIY